MISKLIFMLNWSDQNTLLYRCKSAIISLLSYDIILWARQFYTFRCMYNVNQRDMLQYFHICISAYILCMYVFHEHWYVYMDEYLALHKLIANTVLKLHRFSYNLIGQLRFSLGAAFPWKIFLSSRNNHGSWYIVKAQRNATWKMTAIT